MKITKEVLLEIKSNFEHAQQEIDTLKSKINQLLNLYFCALFIAFLSLLISIIR